MGPGGLDCVDEAGLLGGRAREEAGLLVGLDCAGEGLDGRRTGELGEA